MEFGESANQVNNGRMTLPPPAQVRVSSWPSKSKLTFLVLPSEQVQNGRVQVVDADGILDRGVTEFIRRAVSHTAAREPEGKPERIVVAPAAALHHGQPPERRIDQITNGLFAFHPGMRRGSSPSPVSKRFYLDCTSLSIFHASYQMARRFFFAA